MVVNLRTQGEGTYYFPVTSAEDTESKNALQVGMVNQSGRTKLSFDVRISLYEGEHDGPYRLYRATIDDVLALMSPAKSNRLNMSESE